MPIRVRARQRDDRAAVAVEFALIAPLMVLLAAGIIQYGLYFWAMQAGTNAASDAARALSVGNCQSSSALQAFATRDVGSSAASTVTATPTYSVNGTTVASPGQPGGDVSVTVSFQAVNLHLPLVPLPNGGSVIRTFHARVESITALGTC